VGRSALNYQAGGRTKLSGMINSLGIFVVIILFPSVIGKIPKVVMAGVILVLAFHIIDKWSLELFFKFFLGKIGERKRMAWNFLVISLVLAVTIFFKIIVAVGVGVFISLLVFLTQMRKTVIRRDYRCVAVHSRKQRGEKHMSILVDHGDRIAVLELEGAIFFGTADSLFEHIDKLNADGVEYIMLDMKRVNDIDYTGARIMKHIHLKLKKKNGLLAISYLNEKSHIWQFLDDMGLLNIMGKKVFFPDTDMALEFFEDQIIKSVLTEDLESQEMPLKDFSVLADFKEHEIEILSVHLIREKFNKGEFVFRQGDRGDALFFVVKGSVEISISLESENRNKRLQTISSGTVFGEMTFLDGNPRSANAEARESVICYRLNRDGFHTIKAAYPHIAISLLSGMSRLISHRLRMANEMISELEL
jgi:MFS superfamily sulfate permease-like transporter